MSNQKSKFKEIRENELSNINGGGDGKYKDVISHALKNIIPPKNKDNKNKG